MKKLKDFKFIVMAMFVAMLSMSLMACSDDDDDSVAANYAESIVGTWQYGSVEDEIIMTYKFNSNGTGEIAVKKYEEYGHQSESYSESISYTYIYNKETGYGILSIADDEGTTNYKVKRFVNTLHIYSSTNSSRYTEFRKIN